MSHLLLVAALAGCVTVEREVPGARPDAGGPADAAPDAPDCPGAPTQAPRPLDPWNGATTGSLHAADSLRPRFRWQPVVLSDGAEARYEIEIDDSCEIGKHARCPMPSPEAHGSDLTEPIFVPESPLGVSDVVPVGRRYAWHVRACDPCGACGPASEGRYVDVGREAGDLDGDGYADVAVGAYLEDDSAALRVDQGEVTIFRGGPDPIAPSAREIAPPLPQASSLYGFGIAMAGDLDGDGFGDFVVGAFLQNAPEGDEGVAWVFYGDAAGSSASPTFLDAPRELVSGSFGVDVAGVGDLDADGYADLVIGAHGSSIAFVNEGAAYVFRGGPDGVEAWPSAELRSPALQEGGIFGRRVAGAGDVDGDGRSDFVVGAQWEDGAHAEQGAAYLYGGWASALANMPTVVFEEPEPQEDGNFGAGLTGAGDVNDDGYGDVLVASTLYDAEPGQVDEGLAYLFLGGPDGPASAPSTTLGDLQAGGPGFFGLGMGGLGDVDGDGYDDVVIGAPANLPGGVAGAGEAFFYAGGPDGLEASGVVLLSPPTPQTALSFGQAIGAPGDVDGDGHADLVIGAPLLDAVRVDEGAAYFHRGTPEGPSPELETLSGIDHQVSSVFGSSIGSPSP